MHGCDVSHMEVLATPLLILNTPFAGSLPLKAFILAACSRGSDAGIWHQALTGILTELLFRIH